ncbi:kinase domain-containing protein [Favolaschia claudopus]|uniref:Kinase domain-containing protein n=1 Tax=Favolaschia claudopus TaxID=2862362 RepID=A0AAW0E7W1_9AGAR
MSPSFYDCFLTLITLASWYLTFRKISAMDWERPTDARDLAEHCSKYVIPKEEFSELETEASGNAFVVFGAEYQGQRVVVKRWHGAVLPQQSRVRFTKRLIRDLDRWQTLDHPNIAHPVGVALHISNLPALVVPSYRTVNQVLAADHSTDVCHLMHGVAAGLSFLHAQSPPIVHGDLKGSTVFVSPSGSALLSDIGIAGIPQPPDWGFHGVDDSRWLAPELMDTALRPDLPDADSTAGAARTPDATLPITTESDVYSFGMLSYEMHTRKRPFATTIWAAAVIVRIVEGKRPPRPSQDQSPQLSEALWDIIQLCWAHDFRHRPRMQTVEAWLSLLIRLQAVGNPAAGIDCGSLLL